MAVGVWAKAMGIRVGADILDYRFRGKSAGFTILDVPVSIGADYIFGVVQDGSMVLEVSVSREKPHFQ